MPGLQPLALLRDRRLGVLPGRSRVFSIPSPWLVLVPTSLGEQRRRQVDAGLPGTSHAL